MYIIPSVTAKSFRDARANLSALAHSATATIILDRNEPIAILVPLDTVGMSHPGPKDRRIAHSRALFLGALDRLRTQ